MCDAGARVLDWFWFVVSGGSRTARAWVGVRCGDADCRGVVCDAGSGLVLVRGLGRLANRPYVGLIDGDMRMGVMLCLMRDLDWFWFVVLGGSRTARAWVGVRCGVWIGYGSWSWAVREPPLRGLTGVYRAARMLGASVFLRKLGSRGVRLGCHCYPASAG